MHNPKSVLANEAHKVLWGFEIQTDLLISARMADLERVNKKRNCQIVDTAVPAEQSIRLKEKEKRDEYLHLAEALKKTMKHKGAGDTNCY